MSDRGNTRGAAARRRIRHPQECSAGARRRGISRTRPLRSAIVLCACLLLAAALLLEGPALGVGTLPAETPNPADAASRADRLASRYAFRNQTDQQALTTVRQKFAELLDAPALRWPALHSGERVKGYLNDQAAVVSEASGRQSVVESTMPLRGTTPGGTTAPIDLGLVDAGSSAFAPKSAATAVRIPTSSRGELRFPDRSFGVSLDGAKRQSASVSSNKAFFANVVQDGDLVLEPRPQGAELSMVLRSPDAPVSIPLRFDLSGGQQLNLSDGNGTDPLPAGSVEVVEGVKRAAVVYPALASDAQGRAVPVSYKLDGDRLVMQVDTRGELAYPILVDPPIGVYDNNGNSTGQGTTGYTWPNWDQSTFIDPPGSANTSWSFCNNAASNPSKKFYFCQGSLTGTNYSGGPLYIKPNSSQTYNDEDWAQWLKQARPDSYIYRFDAAALNNVGATQAQLAVGVRTAVGTSWEWGSVLWGNGTTTDRGAATPPNSAAYRTPDGTALVGATRYIHVHDDNHQAQPTPADPITPGNKAVLRMIMSPGQPGGYTGLPYVQMGGAATFSSETYAPTLGNPTHSAAISGWIDGSDTVSVTATDRGLGMGTLAVYGPNVFVGQTGGGACTAPSGAANAQNVYDSCPLSVTLNTTYTPPEGISAYTAAATDLVGNRNTAADKTWPVKVDNSAPVLSLSGAAWDDRNIANDDGTIELGYISADETLQAAASDGSASTPRSGVASVEMRVDGQRVHAQDAQTQACSTSGCPYTFSPTFTYHPIDFAEGDHTVTIIARDQLAPPTSTVAGLHVTVQTFTVHSSPVPDITTEVSPENVQAPPTVDPLTPQQEVTAQTIVNTDAVNPLSDLNRVLGISTYHIVDAYPLTQGEPVNGHDPTFGATLTLALDAPRTVDTSVISFAPPWPGTSAYVPYRAHMIATGLTDVSVDIDFSTNSVINIEPGPDSSASTYEPMPGQGPLPVEDYNLGN